MFSNSGASDIVLSVCETIKANKIYLSEVDGAIGDGDHGANMAKGFGLAANRIAAETTSYSDALEILGTVLLTEIGGSMGPLYGTFFLSFGKKLDDVKDIGAEQFLGALRSGAEAVMNIGGAQVGDKTMIDTLVPAIEAFELTSSGGATFAQSLGAMSTAAIDGRDSTKDMVSKLGRSSRLGERSRGTIDAGAASCAMILTDMAATIRGKLDE